MPGKDSGFITSRLRFSGLLVALLLLAILNPLLEEFGLIKAQILLNLLFTLILLSGTYAVSESRRAFILALILAISTITLTWLRPLFPGKNFELIVEILLASYFLLIAILIMLRVLKDEKVTGEKISAALCVYLLIGIVFAFFYTIENGLHPGAYRIDGTGFSQFVYYSMITLTTVGYGDITPLTPFTRALAFVEAITGQFYLAVLVARLVGLHIVHASESKSN